MGTRLGRLSVGVALGLMATACTPGSPSTTVAPSTSTMVTPTTTGAPPAAVEPDELVVFPDPVGPGERLELCTG
ncbi:MAG TPA: hypothetical protein ENK55_03340, partial [Actinobacteria bacterium]|nr:hypothetical protein [Actinomycetota bacterium]